MEKKTKQTQIKFNVENIKSIAYFDASRGELDRYFVLNVFKRKLTRVSKKEFSSNTNPLVVFQDSKYKYNFGTRSQIITMLKKIHGSWKPESLTEDLTDGIRNVISLLKTIVHASKVVNKTTGLLSNLLAKSQTFYESNEMQIKIFLAEFTSILLKFVDLSANRISVASFLDTLLSFYKLFCLSKTLEEKWKAQSMTSLTLSFVSLYMPKHMFELFKRMSLFSSSKILDDVSGAFQFYTLISRFLKHTVDMLPFKLPDSILSILTTLFSMDHYAIMNEASALYDIWYKNRRIILEEDFRIKITKLNAQISNTPNIEEILRRSAGMKSIHSKFIRLYKNVLSYESSSRVEPVCYAWEGPPGSTKSKFMSAVIKSSKTSSYAHIVKSVDEGKDFHDSYNSEEIYYIDDIGQQGKSQFRTLINLVSSVKMPLDCASVELKDTKFFVSDKIFVTTNEFMTLAGFTKTDCIANKQALWRRVYVFNFNEVKIHQGYVTGKISHNFFNVRTSKWEVGFPQDQLDYFRLHGFNIPSVFIADESNFIKAVAWMTVITKTVSDMKKAQKIANDMTVEDISAVETYMEEFKAESDNPPTYEEYLEIVDQTMEVETVWCRSFIMSTLVDMKNTISYMLEYVSSFLTTSSWMDIIHYVAATMSFCSILHTAYIWISSFFSNTSYTGYASECAKSLVPFVTPLELSSMHTAVRAVSKQVYNVKLISKGDHIESNSSVGFINGRYVMTTHHTCVSDKAYLIVYKNKAIDQRIIDNIHVTIAYRNIESDIAVWKLPDNYPLPFKKIKVCDKYNVSNKCFLLTPEGVIPMDAISSTPVSIPTPYSITTHNRVVTNHITPNDYFYSISGSGLCGSLVVDNAGKILGLHVAGNDSGVGSALKLPAKTLFQLDQVFSNLDTGLSLNSVEMSDKDIPNFSGIKLENTGIEVYTPKKSNYIKTPIFATFPVTRQPANLSVYGPHTIKDVAKKSFTPVQIVDSDEIIFATNCMDLLIDEFSPITMAETINGTDVLAGMNKKSSNGFECPKSKHECLNYDAGCLTPEFQKSYDTFLDDLSDGSIDLRDVISVETLKDEIRNVEKEAPRSFRVSRIHFQILMKRLFGGMVENIVLNKWFNQIAVGINPFKDWRRVYDTLNGRKLWAGDIKSWDGSMLPQAQQAVIELLVSKLQCTPKEKDLASKILGFAIYCPVAINNTTLITTHSMPSGIFLTAILNSIINRFYTGMWYHRQMKGLDISPQSFLSHVGDFVYGDDKLNYLLDNKYSDRLNALTMASFFTSIGMGFTTSDKQVIVKPFEDLSEISFLKRKFVYHKQIEDIVGPLEVRTLYSGLSWFDKSKEGDQVLQDKISAFQREIFLHENSYNTDISILEESCVAQNIPFAKLPASYLIALYRSPDYALEREKYGIKF